MKNGRRGEDRRSRSTALHASIFIPLINSILVVHRSFIRTSVSLYLTLPRRPSLSRLSLSLSAAYARSFISSLSFPLPVYFPLPLLPVSRSPHRFFPLVLTRRERRASCPFSFRRPSLAFSVLLALVRSLSRATSHVAPTHSCPHHTAHIRTTDTNSVTTKSAWLRASRVNPRV